VNAYSDATAPDWAFSDQAGSYADLAIARLGRGELDGAADAITPVLELEPERRINGIVHSMQRVHESLRADFTGDQQASGMVEAIEDFTRTPVAAVRRRP
jgi:hypothetical protein